MSSLWLWPFGCLSRRQGDRAVVQRELAVWETIIELDDGKIYRKPLYLMVKTMVSCRFSLKPIHWNYHNWTPPTLLYYMELYGHIRTIQWLENCYPLATWDLKAVPYEHWSNGKQVSHRQVPDLLNVWCRKCNRRCKAWFSRRKQCIWWRYVEIFGVFFSWIFMRDHQASTGGGSFHESHRVGTEDDLTGACRACTGAVVWCGVIAGFAMQLPEFHQSISVYIYIYI